MASSLGRSLRCVRRTLMSSVPRPSESLLGSQIETFSRFSLGNLSVEDDLSDDESRRRIHNRLLYRSRQRGLLELDLVLGTWVEDHIGGMDQLHIRALSDVLDLENPDLWKWLTGQELPPTEVKSNPVFGAIQSKFMANLNRHSSREARADPGQPWVRGWDDDRVDGGAEHGNQ